MILNLGGNIVIIGFESTWKKGKGKEMKEKIQTKRACQILFGLRR